MTTFTPTPMSLDPSRDPSSPFGSGTEPEIQLPKAEAISIQLVSDTQESASPCAFWIGLMAQGSHSPGSLLDFPEATAILTQASTAGVLERAPVMLSDSRYIPPRHIYLMPRPPSGFRESATWIQEILRTVTAWAPAQIGIYMAPALVRYDASHELMLTILRELIAIQATHQFFLFTGEHGLHSVLNAALRLKAELAGEMKTPPILVFH